MVFMKYFGRVFFIFLLLSAVTYSAMADGETHLIKYAEGMPGDKTLERAATMQVKIPVMCREWHIWWGAPVGVNPHIPRWQHWNNLNYYGQYDPQKTLEQLVPGTSWRRWIMSNGYPLLGPYDAAQPDIIRWQLETARNAGLECLHIHLWPSISDEGIDFTPLPVFEQILDTAAAMKYPVAVHDEIQFRRPPFKAQLLDNSIKRAAMLVKRYGGHPGWYKIDNMPVYYFQNWSAWLKPADMQTFFAEVEKQAGPVYWMVEQGDSDEVFRIPQVKAVLSHNNAWFLHVPPYGQNPHPWNDMIAHIEKAGKLARKYNKKYGVLIFAKFNQTHARKTMPGGGVIPADEGNFLLDSVEKSLQCKPDFLLLTQWNDFEECGFIEPAWDFDGFNGDPYRYCRIVAAMTGKKFTLAKLPDRNQLDPYIRFKLFGDSAPGDMGPVAHYPVINGTKLNMTWAPDGPPPTEVRLVQNELAVWQPEMYVYHPDQKLRLGNWSHLERNGELSGNRELRFYAPGLVATTPQIIWIGIKAFIPEGTQMTVNYRGPHEYFRIDSRWELRQVQLDKGFSWSLPDKSKYYWLPLYSAGFTGAEGDLLIRLGGKKEPIYLREIVLWAPWLKGADYKPESSLELKGVDITRPLVVVGYDKAGNAGQPLLISQDITSVKKQ